jgi:hypothetical protein
MMRTYCCIKCGYDAASPYRLPSCPRCGTRKRNIVIVGDEGMSLDDVMTCIEQIKVMFNITDST